MTLTHFNSTGFNDVNPTQAHQVTSTNFNSTEMTDVNPTQPHQVTLTHFNLTQIKDANLTQILGHQPCSVQLRGINLRE